MPTSTLVLTYSLKQQVEMGGKYSTLLISIKGRDERNFQQKSLSPQNMSSSLDRNDNDYLSQQ